MKRFRGKPTEKPFGAAGAHEPHGRGGRALLPQPAAGSSRWSTCRAAGYFREDAVFALEEAVVFENGRVPSRHSRDLDLVHLRGRGTVLLRTARRPVAIEISGRARCGVPPAALVGWTGAVTPRLGGAARGRAAPGRPVMVELTGEGASSSTPTRSTAE